MSTRAAELLALCKDVLATAGVAEAEICAQANRRGVARFAHGELGQHMDLDDPEVLVRAAVGKRVAEVTTSRLDREGLVAAVRDAERAARLVPETDAFPGFADAGEAAPTPPRWCEGTARATAETRAELLRPVLSRVAGAGLVAAGILETRETALAVATTRGCARLHDATNASFKVWALETPGAGGAAGYGGHLHRDVGALALEAETERAIRMCRLGKDPTVVEAGAYDVVLEPPAVVELLEWLSTIAFGAPEVAQGTSPFAGRIGERITGEGITLVEDPVDPSPLGFGAPFDREGTPRRRVTLLERGVAREILYDRTYGAREGKPSTGSALKSGLGDASVGTTCSQLEGGDAASVDELLAGITRGLYICRLHYVNGFLEPRRAVMTGLTRDGCFLVENGKISRAVGNVRFTDSVLEGLSREDGRTRQRAAVPSWWSGAGATVAPAVRMRAFVFNGRSQTQPTLK